MNNRPMLMGISMVFGVVIALGALIIGWLIISPAPGKALSAAPAPHDADIVVHVSKSFLGEKVTESIKDQALAQGVVKEARVNLLPPKRMEIEIVFSVFGLKRTGGITMELTAKNDKLHMEVVNIEAGVVLIKGPLTSFLDKFINQKVQLETENQPFRFVSAEITQNELVIALKSIPKSAGAAGPLVASVADEQ